MDILSFVHELQKKRKKYSTWSQILSSSMYQINTRLLFFFLQYPHSYFATFRDWEVWHTEKNRINRSTKDHRISLSLSHTHTHFASKLWQTEGSAVYMGVVVVEIKLGSLLRWQYSQRLLELEVLKEQIVKLVLVFCNHNLQGAKGLVLEPNKDLTRTCKDQY